MPLRFTSLSHGDIAFGFFNVQSDMLLLENNFFFADVFCRQITALEDSRGEGLPFNVWHISNRSDMGDFRSFLGEKRDVGFWGEVYRHYPYPERPEDFHQKPDGWQTQPEVTGIIGKYGAQKEILFKVDPDKELVYIGDYCFSYPVFKELIRYVWVGGYPKWQDGIRPEYVMHMKEKIAQSDQPFFRGINFAVQPG
ncbi:MAG: hypothetical protein HY847_00145 [Betaproteobacteria bacterium]|nr:hypothetical protein [Betaproteobacteria bacterium]